MAKDETIGILVLAANPTDTAPLRLDQEVREISEGLLRARKRDSFTMQSRWAVRVSDLRRALLDLQPAIVHFSGHGTVEGIVLENQSGQSQIISPDALSGLFALFKDQVKCVLLNACYSAKQAYAITQHVDYVIGMNKEIGDKAAIEFAIGFYDALGAGRSIEDAYKFGCNAVQLYGIPEHLTPVLHKKDIAVDTPVLERTESPHTKSAIRVNIFISYSHLDKELHEELERHLSQLKHEGLIDTWHDRKINPSDEWKGRIDTQLNAAEIILLLVSANFLSSDYSYDIEMKRALERHEAGTARVIPVILKPCDWEKAPFSKLAALPTDAKPVTQWPDRDLAFLNVAKGIRQLIEEITTNP